MPLLVGAVADDDTGATDLGSMLAEQGIRSAVVFTQEAATIARAAKDVDALILGTAARSIAKIAAYRRTREAVKTLNGFGTKHILIKYCSTFDSTSEGNIGASIDAAMDELGINFTLALPAQPSLGRTTYMGYHFVGKQLLSDSPMRNHPLNPMTNPYLPSHLATQTLRRIGVLTADVIQSGSEAIERELTALQSAGTNIVLCDCLNNEQLKTLGEAAQSYRLLTGSSAWGSALPPQWRTSAADGDLHARPLTRAAGGRGILAVSGSCSEATSRQNNWARKQQGWHVFDLDVEALIAGKDLTPVETICELLRRDARVLITTQQNDREQHTRSAVDEGLDATQFGERISAGLSSLVAQIFAEQTPSALIVAGGETSSALMRSLALGGMYVGPTVERGVPIGTAINQPSLALVLKSGNFGSDEFFGRAADAVAQIQISDEENSR